MPDFLIQTFPSTLTISPGQVALRLLVALGMGGLIAWVYAHTRGERLHSPTFPPTLVLLAVLIAMVTQVIGDNVARAFSLVGALSIVRFRTVVRDTQDTAFVIFAVVVGMAIGSGDPWVGAIGMVVVSFGAYLTMPARKNGAVGGAVYVLKARVGLGHDVEAIVQQAIEPHVSDRRLVAVSTARQGTALEAAYEIQLKPGRSAAEVVAAVNRTEGIQSVEVVLQGASDEVL